MKYISPKALEKSFTCPHCGTIAMQEWWRKTWEGFNSPIEIIVGTYQHCNKNTL